MSGGCKCKSTSRLSTRQHTQNWGAAHFELLREKMMNPEKIKNRKMMDERLGLIYILKNNKIKYRIHIEDLFFFFSARHSRHDREGQKIENKITK